MQRSPPLGTRFGESQRPVIKLESRQRTPFGTALTACEPMQAPGDHQVDDQPEVILKAKRDTFAEAPHFPDTLAEGLPQWRLRASEKKWTRQAHALERTALHPSSKCFDVERDVRQFRHEVRPIRRRSSMRSSSQRPDSWFSCGTPFALWFHARRNAGSFSIAPRGRSNGGVALRFPTHKKKRRERGKLDRGAKSEPQGFRGKTGQVKPRSTRAVSPPFRNPSPDGSSGRLSAC